MTGLYKKISLVLVGLLIAIFFSEVFLRFLGFPASSIYRVDEKTGLLTFKPDSSIYIRSECFSNVIKTNSLGFHSKEYNLEKTAGVFRIAVIGDSFIEASQVPIEKTFAYLLEKKLNNQTDKQYSYEVMPFGISSHGTYKSLFYLKAYALDFKPDLVIAAYSLNDLEDDFREMIQFNEYGQPVLEISLVEYKSVIQTVEAFFKKNLRKSVLVTTLRKEILQLKSKLEKKTINTPISDDPEKINQAWETEEKLLTSFNNIVKNSSSKFLLASLADARAYDFMGGTEEAKRLKLIADHSTFDYFDLMPVFIEKYVSEKSDFTWPCDGHWNETGNQWVAEALLDYLISSNLIKK
ncbi:MAG: SGNH/GDSL hydrolase family protein [Patescibacteria group bacterium]